MIFQTFNLIPVLNVYENIEFPLLLQSKDPNSKSPVDDFTKAQKEEWINFLMEKVGLADWKDHKANELSGGQRQRVAIVRAMMNDPKVLFADEPTASLDHENAFLVMNRLKEYSKNRLVIVITHDRSIMKDADMMVEVWDGSISSVKKAEEIV